MLRRIHKELARSNEISVERLNLEKDRLALERPDWYRAGGRVPAKTKKVDFGRASIDDWNKQFNESHPDATNQSRP